MAKKLLVDTLVAKKIIELTEAAAIKQEAKEKDLPLEDILYQHGVSEQDVAETKAELLDYQTNYLQGAKVPLDVLRDIPEESARHYQMIPLGKKEGYLNVGMLHPEDVNAVEALKFIAARTGLPTKIFIITPSDFQNIMQEYRSLSGEVKQALGEFEKEYESLGDTVKVRPQEEPGRITDDAPVTKMVSVVLRHAVEGSASDIHIEPERDKLRVRFRVDGILHTSLTLPIGVHPAVISRIKVMSNLKIDETRVPQDGRFHARVMDREIDFRVSTFPTAFGEKIVIRILDPNAGIATLEDIGLVGRNLTLIEENIKRPFGLILITGPTGSGKSTTLYAILRILNQEKSNIVSLEDPIEYYLEGVNQSQIRPEIGYDFANGLRSILRQDPDIIMVGEIRDKETAGLAIHAALTGHLVLATLHTNNAVGVIPRLIDMGVDPFLLPPTLILTIAQRLVRKLCPDSRKDVLVTGQIKEMMKKEIDAMPAQIRAEMTVPSKISQAEASSVCPKGTRGRTGIFEVINMTPQLEKIILTNPSESAVKEEADRQGMLTMRQDGILKVIKGQIGLEELLEVV